MMRSYCRHDKRELWRVVVILPILIFFHKSFLGVLCRVCGRTFAYKLVPKIQYTLFCSNIEIPFLLYWTLPFGYLYYDGYDMLSQSKSEQKHVFKQHYAKNIVNDAMWSLQIKTKVWNKCTLGTLCCIP